jgi:hypothetical protein
MDCDGGLAGFDKGLSGPHAAQTGRAYHIDLVVNGIDFCEVADQADQCIAETIGRNAAAQNQDAQLVVACDVLKIMCVGPMFHEATPRLLGLVIRERSALEFIWIRGPTYLDNHRFNS